MNLTPESFWVKKLSRMYTLLFVFPGLIYSSWCDMWFSRTFSSSLQWLVLLYAIGQLCLVFSFNVFFSFFYWCHLLDIIVCTLGVCCYHQLIHVFDLYLVLASLICSTNFLYILLSLLLKCLKFLIYWTRSCNE